MNLLIFISSMNAGGAERVAANLANHWAGKGWNVTVVTVYSAKLDFYELHPAVRRIPLNLASDSENPPAAVVNNLRRIGALRRVLRAVQPDIALALMGAANILLAPAATGLRGIATVGSERTHPPQYPLGTAWETLRTHLYGRLTALTALTQESSAWLRRHTRARKIVVIPNAATFPLPEREPYLEPLDIPQGMRMLLAVGRLSEEKCFDLLIATFQRLAEEFPDWMLVILGEGPDRAALEQQVQSTGLVDRIRLPGRAGNVGRWYNAADLYVMSSRFEGFPNTLVEALAHGLPAVSFDCDTGPRDIVRHGVDGLLVPAGDTNALEGALHGMMADRSLRHRFAQRAVEARERFSIEKIAAMWEALFEELRGAKPR